MCVCVSSFIDNDRRSRQWKSPKKLLWAPKVRSSNCAAFLKERCALAANTVAKGEYRAVEENAHRRQWLWAKRAQAIFDQDCAVNQRIPHLEKTFCQALDCATITSFRAIAITAFVTHSSRAPSLQYFHQLIKSQPVQTSFCPNTSHQRRKCSGFVFDSVVGAKSIKYWVIFHFCRLFMV